MNNHPTIVASTALLLLVLQSGCGGSNAPGLVEVTGTVTLDGKPVHGAVLDFRSEDSGMVSIGATDENGKFRLLYKQDNYGATPGKHTVSITTGSIPPNGDPGTPIPMRYGDRRTSKLTADVKMDGTNDLTFKLTSQ